MLKKISNYCLGNRKVNVLYEKTFLSNIYLQKFTNINLSNNSGKISEWYIEELLKKRNINYISQPRIQYGDKSKYILPDFYIPSKNLFIEVKSRTYNCKGTASEKIDHVARKYSTKLSLTEHYKDAKVLVVFCAGELFEESTLEIINYDENSQNYIKEFIELTKRHAILDWINIKDIDKYLD